MRDYDRYDRNDTIARDRYDYGQRDDSSFFGWDNDDHRSRHSEPYVDNRSYSRDRDFGPDQDRRGIARNETRRLIASNKVEGTPVYGRDGDQLGSIHNFMVEKRSGKVRYAVLKTSEGFLGLDERYYPLDWNELTYDTRVDGYHVNMTDDDLDRRRSFDSRGRSIRSSDWRDNDMRSRSDYERSTW